MVQRAASLHDWTEGRGEDLVLLRAIDDATNRLRVRFSSAAAVATPFDLVGRWLQPHGRLLAFYTDRPSIIEPPAKGRAVVLALTQFGRALEELDIEFIRAHRPQAKGRAERSLGQAQNRWAQEMRLAQVRTCDQANAWLEKERLKGRKEKKHCDPAQGRLTSAAEAAGEILQFPFGFCSARAAWFGDVPMNVPGKSSALVLLGWLLVSVAPAGADEPAKAAGRKVVVQSSATVYVAADAARLSFTLGSSGLGKAREENEKQARKLMETLTAATKEKLDVHVTPLTLSTVISGGGAGAIGFGGAIPGAPGVGGPGAPTTETQAQTLFTVTVREKDPEKLKALAIKIADTAKENGAKGSGNEDMYMRRGFRMAMGGMDDEASSGPSIEWLTENTGEARKAAIKKAVQNALESAQAAVGDTKLTLSEISITSQDEVMMRYRGMRNTDTSGEPGRIPVTVQVTVTYTF